MTPQTLAPPRKPCSAGSRSHPNDLSHSNARGAQRPPPALRERFSQLSIQIVGGTQFCGSVAERRHRALMTNLAQAAPFGLITPLMLTTVELNQACRAVKACDS